MSFTEILTQDRPIVSLEFFPPRKESALEQSLALITELASLQPDFMTVTYGAGGGTRSLTKKLTAFIAQEINIPAVAHLTCVGHTADEIDDLLAEFLSAGISHILGLRGDPPKGADSFTATEGGFSCARDLIKHITAKGTFSIAAAGYPETHLEATSAEADLAYLKEKVAAGAEVIITQLFFSSDLYLRFRDKCNSIGITVPILPGIMPIRNVSQVKRFTAMCGASIPESVQRQLEKFEDSPDAVKEYGIELATRLCQELLEAQAPGVHLYTLNKSAQVKAVVHNIEHLLKRS